MNDASSTSAPVAASSEFQASQGYRYYVVWLLSLVYLFNQVDRQILSILIEPIKREFEFTDLQMGVLGGLAFALFYSTLGIPIARFADRSNRVNIIAASLALWSLFTAITGMARNFWHLLFARVAVGIGEAGCSPPAYSVISDYFDPKRRATAISIYSLGVPGGSVIGLLVGGALAEAYGWRTAFYVLGLPGIALALIVKLTLREPPRGFSDTSPSRQEILPVRQVLKSLASKPSFRNLSLAAAFHAFPAYGVAGFYAAFLIRSHGMNIAEAGRWLALATVIGGLLGTYLGGKLADLFTNRHNDVRWQMWVPAIALIINLPVAAMLFTVPDKYVVIAILTVNIGLGSMYLAPTIAATQRLVGLRERALATALLFLVLNLIGMGLGPVATGAVSDMLNQYFLNEGESATKASADGLRFALMCMVSANILSIICYVRATRTLRAELVS